MKGLSRWAGNDQYLEPVELGTIYSIYQHNQKGHQTTILGGWIAEQSIKIQQLRHNIPLIEQ